MESIGRLNQAVRFIRAKSEPGAKGGKGIALSQVQFFLEVVLAHPDPVSLRVLTDRVGVAHSITSRNSKEIFGTQLSKSTTGQTIKLGLGWVDSGPSRWGGKEFDVWLTPAGVEVAKELALVVDGGNYGVSKR